MFKSLVGGGGKVATGEDTSRLNRVNAATRAEDEATLASPLLVSEGGGGVTDDTRFDMTPIRGPASTTLMGTPVHYARVDEDPEERRARASEEALRRQETNKAQFEEAYRQEEDRVLREARMIADDAKLAAELQRAEENAAVTSSTGPRVMVQTVSATVPRGLRGGMLMRTAVPGKGEMDIMVPAGLSEGDTFTFKVPFNVVDARPLAQVRVRVPAGVRPGGAFRCTLPNGRVVNVGVPPGCFEGMELAVPFDQNTGDELPTGNVVSTDLDPDAQLALMQSAQDVELTAEERAERDALLKELPAELHAEVIASWKAQKQQFSSFRGGAASADASSSRRAAPPSAAPISSAAAPKLTAEQIALLDSLEPALRAEVERDMLREIASLPAASVPPAATGRPFASQTRPAAAGSTATSAPPRPAAATGLPPAATSSYPVVTPSKPPKSPGGDLLSFDADPVPGSVDMFQNLSIRGGATGQSGRKPSPGGNAGTASSSGHQQI